MNIVVGLHLSRPDGHTATVTAVSPTEVTIEIDEWTSPDNIVEPACVWTGHPSNIVNCWNISA